MPCRFESIEAFSGIDKLAFLSLLVSFGRLRFASLFDSSDHLVLIPTLAGKCYLV